MKHLTFLLGVFLILVSASCTKEKTVIINGTVANAESEQLFLTDNVSDKTDTLALVDGKFSIETTLDKEQFLYLRVGRQFLHIYAEPGNIITITLDEAEFIKQNLSNVIIEGSEASKLLNSIELNNSSIDFGTLLAFDSDIFETSIQNMQNKNTALVDSFNSEGKLSKTFESKAKILNNISLANKYNMYAMYHKRFAPNDTSAIPEHFATYGSDISLNNYDYFKEMIEYKGYVINNAYNKINNILEEKDLTPYTKAYLETQFSEIKTFDTFTEVKDALGSRIISSYTRMPDSLKTVIESNYKSVISDEKIIKEFEDKIAKTAMLKEGNPAPGFSYPDIDGNIVNSADLKGKVIYIDVWATWCGPCKREIPFLKELEKELHKKDIAFVSISVDEDKAAWEKMVANEALKGYQLFAKDAWNSEIIKNYLISGIPRFIMVDKSGNIISANATRPSNPETKETLLKYADM